MIKTVVRYHHWTPSVIERLYLHGSGVNSLQYWYDDVVKVNKELEPKPKPPTAN